MTRPKKGDRERAEELFAESERLQHDLWTVVAHLDLFTQQLRAKIEAETSDAEKEG